MLRTPSPRSTGLSIFAIALLLRLCWIGWKAASGLGGFEFDDERLHWELARNWVQHGELVSDDGRRAARMPGYPLFLALPAALPEPAGPWAARVLQAIVGAATAWLAFDLVRTLAGARGALVAGSLVAIDPFQVFFCHLLLTEVVFSAMLVLFLRGAAGEMGLRLAEGDRFADQRQAGAGRGFGCALLTAFAGAAMVITRPATLGMLPIFWMMILARAVARGRSSNAVGRPAEAPHTATRIAGRLSLYALALTVLLAPWGLRNRAVLGEFAWLGTNGGVTLYDSLGPQADGSGNQDFLRHMPEFAVMSEVQRDRRLAELALEQVRSDPARVLHLAWVKLRRTWSLLPHAAGYTSGPAAWAGAIFTAVLAIGAIAGLVRLLGCRQGWLALLLASPVLYFTLLHMVYVGSVRYRVPLMPILALLCGCAWLIIQRRRESRAAAD